MKFFRFFLIVFIALLTKISLAGSPEHIQLDSELLCIGVNCREGSGGVAWVGGVNTVNVNKCQYETRRIVILNSKIKTLENEIEKLDAVKLKLNELTSIINELHGKLKINLSASDKKIKSAKIKNSSFEKRKEPTISIVVEPDKSSATAGSNVSSATAGSNVSSATIGSNVSSATIGSNVSSATIGSNMSSIIKIPNGSSASMLDIGK